TPRVADLPHFPTRRSSDLGTAPARDRRGWPSEVRSLGVPLGRTVGRCTVPDQIAAPETEKRSPREQKPVYGIMEIMKILPHRYPFLLVDRIVELEPDKRVVGLKNVTINEQFFQGHFPGAPVMPGVLILEAMAQVAGILIYRDMPEPDRATKLIYFTV